MQKYILLILIIFSIALCIYGCGEVQHEPVAPYLSRITVSPSSKTCLVGSRETFRATGYDQNGANYSISPVWSVTGGIGSVSTAGLFSAEALGTGSVIAAASGVAGSAAVTVSSSLVDEVISVMVVPSSITLSIGDTQTFVATAFYSGGSSATVNPVWSVESGLGSLSVTGVFTAIVGGACTVVATYGGKRGTASVLTLDNPFP